MRSGFSMDSLVSIVRRHSDRSAAVSGARCGPSRNPSVRWPFRLLEGVAALAVVAGLLVAGAPEVSATTSVTPPSWSGPDISVNPNMVNVGRIANLAIANANLNSNYCSTPATLGRPDINGIYGSSGFEFSCETPAPNCCARFAEWVWPNSGGGAVAANDDASYFETYGTTYDTISSTPAVGDVVVFDDGVHSGLADITHVAVVYAVGNGVVSTISGNSGDLPSTSIVYDNGQFTSTVDSEVAHGTGLFDGSINYYIREYVAPVGAYYHNTSTGAPVRVMDTRPGSSHVGALGTIPADAVQTLTIPTSAVPSNAVAVTGNVTVVSPSAAGWVSVGPSLSTSNTARTTSMINFQFADIRTKGLTTPVGSSASAIPVQFYYCAASPSNSINGIFAVDGYFTDNGSGDGYH